jgi:hypothetical protein
MILIEIKDFPFAVVKSKYFCGLKYFIRVYLRASVVNSNYVTS